MLPPLPDQLAPCPFCGATLKRDDKRNTGAQHPPNSGDCPLGGWFIGAANLPGWQRRQTEAAPALSMSVIDNRPVFHDDASGRPVTARELNLYIDWYQSQIGSK